VPGFRDYNAQHQIRAPAVENFAAMNLTGVGDGTDQRHAGFR
jgi:hypothetical protein